jgi:5'-3' exonuclease
VRPESIPDWLALTGDDADGVPGLAGFGAKSAAALLAKFVHLEAIPDDPKAWPATVRGAERLAKTLAGARKEALLYRELTRLRTDVPLPESFEDLAWRGVPALSFDEWAARFGATRAFAATPRGPRTSD